MMFHLVNNSTNRKPAIAVPALEIAVIALDAGAVDEAERGK
jgi:hypothetical protein